VQESARLQGFCEFFLQKLQKLRLLGRTERPGEALQNIDNQTF
jgi:hypothetical protein